MEKKDNNEDEGRVKRKDEYPSKEDEGRNGGQRMGGPRRMKEKKKKEEEGEAEAGNLDRVDHPLKLLDTTDGRPVPAPLYAKIWILLDLSRP